MKARVNTFLNIRTGTPEILPDNNPNDLFFKPGDVVEIAETVTGEKYKNINIWYKLVDGVFIWSGGADKPNVEVSGLAARSFASISSFPVFDPNKISWAHNALKITDIWRDAGVAGEKARVAILEEDFDLDHDDLKPILFENFTSITGQNGHGTLTSGIIGAKGNKVFGIAPRCEMLFAKVNFDDTDSIVKALQWAVRNEADIISLSFQCNKEPVVEDEFEQCFNKNIALIAAAGDSGAVNGPLEYPASSSFCFAVGCFGRDFKRMRASVRSQNLKLLAPGESLLTAWQPNTSKEENGLTSIATAFTSGVAALLLSVMRSKDNKRNGKEIIEALRANADKRNNGLDEHNIEYGFGLIDPFKTYLNIK